MPGVLGETVAEQVKRFNDSQGSVTVVPSFKGSYTDAMTGAIAAWRAGNPPHIVQVFEVGTATMMSAGPAIRPVHELLAQSGVALDPKRYLAGVRGYYTDTQGRLISMPHNSSSAIMWLTSTPSRRPGFDHRPAEDLEADPRRGREDQGGQCRRRSPSPPPGPPG